MAVSDNPGEELRAALAARQELGPDFESEIIESFLERLDRTIEARVDAQVSAQLAQDQRAASERKGSPAELVFPSMFGGFLATVAIGATMHEDGLPAVIIVWIAVAMINLAHALAGRPRRPWSL
jgi:regulator of protease activity HflC (stomatin/prohibitin superfamily)